MNLDDRIGLSQDAKELICAKQKIVALENKIVAFMTENSHLKAKISRLEQEKHGN